METHFTLNVPKNPVLLTEIGSLSADPDHAYSFAAGQKKHSIDKNLPWLSCNQEDIARYNVSLRLNDYYLGMLRFISKSHGISQQKFIANIMLPALDHEWENLKQIRSF